MSTDIKELGFRADTSGLRTAEKDLRGLAGAAEQADTAAVGLGKSAQASGKFVKTWGQDARAAANSLKGMTTTFDRSAGTFRAVRRGLDDTAEGVNRTNRAFRGLDLRQPMMQFSQVAQQGSATGNYLQALAIQLPDLTLGFGPLGIALGIAGGALLPFAANLLTAGSNADEAAEALDDYTDSLDKFQSYADTAMSSTKDLREEFGKFADDVRENAEFMAKVAAADALGDMRDSVIGSGASRLQSQLESLEAAMKQAEDLANRELPGNEELDFLRGGSGAGDNRITNLRDDARATAESLGLTLEQAQELLPLIQRMQEADSLEDRAEQANGIVDTIRDMTDGTIQMTDEMIEFLDAMVSVSESSARAAVTLGEVESQAEGVVEADMDDAIEAAADNAHILRGHMEKALEAITGMADVNLGNISSAMGSVGDWLANVGQVGEGRGLLDFIANAEGTARGSHALADEYNTTLDYGKWTGGPRDLVNMTLNDIMELQGQMLANPENLETYQGPNGARGSSALGRYQIVRKTLRGLIEDLNLDPATTRFSPEIQDRMGLELIRQRQGQGAQGLKNEWQGLQKYPDAVITRAAGNQPIPGTDPEVEAESQAALNKALREAEKVRRENAQAAQEHAREVEASADAYESWRGSVDPAEKAAYDYEKAIEAIDLALQNEVISQEEAAKARQLAKADMEKTLEDIKDDLNKDDADEITSSLGDISGALTDMIFEAESFSDAMAGLGNAVKNAAMQIVQSQITKHLEAMLDAGSGAGGGGGGNWLTNLIGAVFSGGGGGSSAPVERPRAGGGNVYPGGVHPVGERGPELFVPSQAGHIVPNNALGGSQGLDISVRHEGVQVRQEETQPGMPPRLVVERMVNDVIGSGRADNTMTGRFGVRPRPRTRS